MIVKKKGTKRNIPTARACIYSTFNNTIVAITNPVNGDVLASFSTGMAGFKGAKKGTPFAAQQAAERAALRAMENYGVQSVSVVVKGPGPGRESAIRALQSAGLEVLSIEDNTSVPHNGCRPRKYRRV